MKSIVLTGGGTAGHCVPNLALLPKINGYFDKIYYIGSEKGIEKSLALNAGLEYYSIPCAKFDRSFILKNLSIPFNLINSIVKAGKILDKIKPNIIFSKGGYVSLPVVLAGKKRKIPIVCHESDLTIGLANKLSAKYCKKVLTSFPETAKGLKNGCHVGSPLLPTLFNYDKKEAIKKFKLSGEKPIVFITGGSLGAKAINQVVRDSLPVLTQKFEVIHQCGKNNLVNKKLSKFYHQYEFIENMADAYACADVCVSRAGSNTVFELLALKKPSILIPLPKDASRGDQILNAEYFQKKGFVNVLPQNVLTTESLVQLINSTYNNRTNIKTNLSKLDLKSSNDKIVKILNELSSKS